MLPNRAVIVARLVVALWAAFWTWFCVASAFGEKEGLVGGLMHLVPAIVMVASAILAWGQPRVGGVLLIAEAAFVASGLWVQPKSALFAMLGLPPLVAGLLFLAARPPANGTAGRPHIGARPA